MRIGFSILLVAVAVPMASADVGFRQPPTAGREGGRAWLSFAADGPTDVEVAVLSASGKVVRHLAAGLLGPAAPPPLKAGSPAQRLEWDGCDDAGKPAAGGPFRFRVRLGLRPALDGLLGYDRGDYQPLAAAAASPLESVHALAVGPTGELFVFHTVEPPRAMVCSVLDRNGKYLRTISPYPADLPEEKLRGFKRVEVENGRRVPFLYHLETVSLLPGACNGVPTHRAVVTRDGRVAFLVAPRFSKYDPPALQVAAIRSDGSAPDGPVLRTKLAKEKGIVSATLALSPDEKTLYASDVSRGGPLNVVYRFGWDDELPTPFIREGLSDPKGIATDADGNVYVADKGHDRIAVFKPDGAPVGELKFEKPERVEVNPKTGVLYVLGGKDINRLAKFRSWKDGDPLAEAAIPFFRHRNYTAVLALDASAEPAVLWIASSHPYYSKVKLTRIEDLPDGFGEAVRIDQLPAASPSLGSADVKGVSFSRPGGLLSIGSRFYDTRSGAFIEPPDAAVGKLLRSVPSVGSVAGSFGLDGNFYFQLAHATLRLGPDLKVLPFPKGECDAAAVGRQQHNSLIQPSYGHLDKYGGLGSLGGTARCGERGATADAAGNVYSLTEKNWGTVPGPDFTALSKYNPDGSVANLKLIDADLRAIASVRVDLKGNIYLATGLHPGDDLLPPGLQGKLPDGRKDPDAVWGVNFYPLMYGSIVKFGPDGGLIQKGCGGVKCNFGFGVETEVKGAQWVHPGVTGTVTFRTPGAPGSCACDSPRFDVDGYGRVYFPDAGRFRVWVLDTAGNEIGWFGGYGNLDSAGPGSLVPAPAIPLCWPQAVAVDDAGMAYVGDRLSKRVVKVSLAYAAEATVELK